MYLHEVYVALIFNIKKLKNEYSYHLKRNNHEKFITKLLFLLAAIILTACGLGDYDQTMQEILLSHRALPT